MPEYEIEARRADPSGSKATAKDAELLRDTSLARVLITPWISTTMVSSRSLLKAIVRGNLAPRASGLMGIEGIWRDESFIPTDFRPLTNHCRVAGLLPEAVRGRFDPETRS